MFIELTEVLACPDCDAGAGMVAFIDSLAGRHIIEGYLGCPFCGARRPVRAGVVELAADQADETASAIRCGAVAEGGPAAEREMAVQAAALLGLHDRPGGYALLDENFAAAAGQVAELGGGTQIVALVGPTAAEGGTATAPEPQAATEQTDSPPTAVSYVLGAPADSLPVLPGKLRGIALQRGSLKRLESARQALGFEGRLVILAPDPEVAAAVEEGGFTLLAADERALVAVRK